MFKLNKCDYFVLIWVLYTLQGTLYTAAMINRFLQLIMFVWLIVVFYYVMQESNKPKLIRATAAMFFMYLIYGVIHILLGSNMDIGYDVPTYFYLQKAGNSLLPIFLFYYYTKKGYVTEDRIRVYFFVFFIVSLLIYIQNRTYQYEIASVNQIGITNNAGYGILALIPLVYFFYKKTLAQYILLAILSYFVITGAKRGAILSGAICVLYYVLVSSRGNRKKIYVYFLGVLFIFFAYYYMKYTFSTNEYLSYRYEQTMEGNASNRDIIYGDIWRAFWSESSVFSFLFGHGADSTLEEVGIFAHQDWLEIAFNNGLIGVFLLLMFFISYIVNIRDARRCLPKWLVHAFVTILIIGFTKTLVSAFISQIDLCMSVVIGYTLAQLMNWGEIENNKIYKILT